MADGLILATAVVHLNFDSAQNSELQTAHPDMDSVDGSEAAFDNHFYDCGRGEMTSVVSATLDEVEYSADTGLMNTLAMLIN